MLSQKYQSMIYSFDTILVPETLSIIIVELKQLAIEISISVNVV